MRKEKLCKLCLAERVGCMYKGSIKIKELEEEIGKEKMAKFKEKVWLEFGKKEKVYIYFMEYIRFEDKYTDPYVEKTGNYLLNILLYETVGKAEYKKMVSKYAGKKMCITPYKVYRSWNYEKLKKFVTQGKITKEIAEELGIEESNVRKLRQRIRDVTKDLELYNWLHGILLISKRTNRV